MTGGTAVAVACGDTLGESAAWSMREQALYWVDIRGPRLHRLDPVSGTRHDWTLPDLCGGVVPMASGVALALGSRLAHFDPEDGALTTLCEVEPVTLGNRLNELKCDRRGRLWVGSMRDFGAATSGSLYRIDAALRPKQILRDITIPNALGWSPDGATMYFADTRDGRLCAYAYDADAGTLGAMRVLAAADALPGVPDGSAVDAEGHIWTTRVGAGCVLRVAPDGRISATVALPVTQPTSCALGGPDLRTLFITTARQRLNDAELRAQPDAGHLFAVAVDVPGLSDAEFDAPSPITTIAAMAG